MFQSALRRFCRSAFAGLLPFFALSPAVAADAVACHYTYGGETWILLARPVDSPYAASGIAVGSYFQLRVVFQDRPADLRSIKVYAYADRDDGPQPLHQATYAYPPAPPAGAPYGFTGLHFVYEPLRDGELQYWCELWTSGGGR